jgi:hypothetical protein
MIEQTEAERQAIEKAAREQEAAEARTAEANASMNLLLRGGPGEAQEAQPRIKEKLRKRLEKIALDEDNPEDAQWAQDILDGKIDHVTGEPIKERKQPTGPRADGGEGTSMTTPGQWNPFSPLTFTEQVQQALLDKRYGKRHTENHKLPRGDK